MGWDECSEMNKVYRVIRILYLSGKKKYMQPISNDAILTGLLFVILALIFKASSLTHSGFRKFFAVIPPLLLCYFIPSVLSSLNWVDVSESRLYFVASRYFLPASLILLTLSIDLPSVFKLGSKALIMFLTATVGIVLGGPLTILLFSYLKPELVGGVGADAVWRGMSTIAGSWIGGGANQAAMYEVFQPSDVLYSIMITVDVLVAELWMVFLLIGVGRKAKLDSFFRADNGSIEALTTRMEAFEKSNARIPSFTDLMVILGISLGATGLAHWGADYFSVFIQQNYPQLSKFSLTSDFFWLVVLATTFGLLLSFTSVRKYEGAGASKIGTVFIYFLVATIGLKMDLSKIFEYPWLFLVGFVWILFHVLLLFIVARIIRAPYFFLAVGSKANIGGAASAPVVAAAFHPALAPVGVLLAVIGYALGTYGAYLSALLMQMVAP
jgi:uncharacterized membrane protein